MQDSIHKTGKTGRRKNIRQGHENVLRNHDEPSPAPKYQGTSLIPVNQDPLQVTVTPPSNGSGPKIAVRVHVSDSVSHWGRIVILFIVHFLSIISTLIHFSHLSHTSMLPCEQVPAGPSLSTKWKKGKQVHTLGDENEDDEKNPLVGPAEESCGLLTGHAANLSLTMSTPNESMFNSKRPKVPFTSSTGNIFSDDEKKEEEDEEVEEATEEDDPSQPGAGSSQASDHPPRFSIPIHIAQPSAMHGDSPMPSNNVLPTPNCLKTGVLFPNAIPEQNTVDGRKLPPSTHDAGSQTSFDKGPLGLSFCGIRYSEQHDRRQQSPNPMGKQFSDNGSLDISGAVEELNWSTFPVVSQTPSCRINAGVTPANRRQRSIRFSFLSEKDETDRKERDTDDEREDEEGEEEEDSYFTYYTSHYDDRRFLVHKDLALSPVPVPNSPEFTLNSSTSSNRMVEQVKVDEEERRTRTRIRTLNGLLQGILFLSAAIFGGKLFGRR